MDYKEIVMSIKKNCETTIRCNKRIMDYYANRESKNYDGRYYDAEREEYTILETESHQAEIMLDTIEHYLKKIK